MAITVSYSSQSFAGATAGVPLPVGFDAVDASTIKLATQLIGGDPVNVDPGDYVVNTLGPGMFEVITDLTYPNTTTVIVYRSTPRIQPFDLSEGGPLPTEAVNDGLDNLCRQIQELWAAVASSGASLFGPPGTVTIYSQTIFDDATDRGNTAPSYLGQIGVQLDTGASYRGTSLVAGGWTISSASTGDVTGPGSATDNAVALFDGSGGKTVKNSTLTFSSGALGGVTTLNGTSGADLAINATGTNQSIVMTPPGTGNVVIWNESTGADRGLGIYGANAAFTAGPQIVFQRSRGTRNSPTAAQNSDYLGTMDFRARHSTGMPTTPNAYIRAIASQNQTSSSRGAYLSFGTTDNGNSTASEKALLYGVGSMSIAYTHAALSGPGLYISGASAPGANRQLQVSGALDGTNATSAVLFSTTAASGSGKCIVLEATIAGGGASNTASTAASFTNTMTNPIGTTLLAAADFNGSRALEATLTGTSTSYKAGGYFRVSGGDINIGCLAQVRGEKNSATNIGVLATARNTGTSPVQIGVFAGLYNTVTPTFTSAALMADNADSTSPIFVARDNGTPVVTIADGGVTTFAAAPVVPSFTVATVPAATAGGVAFITDEAGGAVLAFADGTNWRRCTDRAIVS